MKYELNPHEPADVHGITLGNSYWEFARQLGSGNASKGIRIALYEASVSRGKDSVCEDNSTRTGNKDERSWKGIRTETNKQND